MLGIHLYEMRHSDGEIMQEHYHDIHQILYVLDGKGKIMLDGRSLDFEQDQGVLIVPRTNHSILSATNMTVLVIEFDEAILDEDVREALLRSRFDRSKLVRLNGFGDKELRQLTRKMLFEQTRESLLNKLANTMYLSELLLLLVRYQPASEAAVRNSLRAEKLRHFIDTHYFEIVSSEDISAKLGVSTRHLNTIFKEFYQMTPLQYLTEVRMRLAQKMLAETDKDIAAICFEIGFETLSTFYRTFKSSIRMTPNNYRKLHR
ncbi:AraC family transcriptional regulator [Paenibacillus sp. UNC451MF]|uniref:AraC family transcriptional regulator n=1 Tax=Paenibacillus sp. UNC451MF TaxID=1449063 RepID=UPI00055D7030|nr:AraC family transcriptional regulator [Paenibacillus sp. UNC451MF]